MEKYTFLMSAIQATAAAPPLLLRYDLSLICTSTQHSEQSPLTLDREAGEMSSSHPEYSTEPPVFVSITEEGPHCSHSVPHRQPGQLDVVTVILSPLPVLPRIHCKVHGEQLMLRVCQGDHSCARKRTERPSASERTGFGTETKPAASALRLLGPQNCS